MQLTALASDEAPQLILVFGGRMETRPMRRLRFVVIMLLLGASVAAHAAEVDQNKQLVRRLYDELFFKWNFAVVDDVISSDFIGHEMPPGMPRGPEAIRQFYGGIRAGLPDVRLTVEDMVGEKDKVVVRWRATATHQGVFLGIPPTGK